MKSWIVAIGESCVDKYIYTEHTRNSPEDPSVPVYKIVNKIIQPGMVQIVKHTLDKLGPIYSDITDEHQGIEKQRIYSNGKQVARIDYDKPFVHEKDIFGRLIDLKTGSREIVYLVSDYGKGLMTPAIIAYICASKARIYLDPHPNNPIDQYKNLHMIKLNEKELEFFTPHVTGASKDLYALRAKDLMQRTGAKHVFVTLGAKGIYYHGADGSSFNEPSQVTQQVKVVEGAGDVVMASLVADMEQGLHYMVAMQRAMKLVAGYVETGIITP